MKTQLFLGALLACAAPLCAQPVDSAPKLTNDLPFPLIAPAKAQQLAAPKPIVIDMDGVTLGAALDELQKQSGVEFETRQGNTNNQLDTKISIKVNTPSFDEAFQEIVAAANLKAILQNWGGDGVPQIYFGGEDEARKTQKSGVGLFQIDLMGIDANLNRSVDLRDFGAPQRSENSSIIVNLGLQTDRRLPLIGTPQTRVTRADDDKGRSLVPPIDPDKVGQNSVNAYNFYGSASWEQQNARLALEAPAKDAKTLADLEGVVVYALVTRTENWEVPDLLSAPQWTHDFTSPDGTTTLVIAVAPAIDYDESNVLNVKIEMASSNGNQSYDKVSYPLGQVEPLLAAMRIVDANGVIYRSQGFSGVGGQNAKGNATFRPANMWAQTNEGDAQPKLAGPFRLIVNAPVEVAQTEVPFSFQNVPLP